MKITEVNNLEDIINKIVCCDIVEFLDFLPDKCVDCVVTSPPFWQQRDYGYDEQIGLESSFSIYLDKMINIFSKIKRVLKKDGTCWVNLGDCFNENTGGYFDNKNNDRPFMGKNRIKTNKYQIGYPRRSLLLIPYRFSIRMIDELGWLCRNIIIWKKLVSEPSSAKNRFSIDYEPFFLFTQKQQYNMNINSVKYYIEDVDCFGESKKTRRSVWNLDTARDNHTNHIAVYPESLVKIPILSCTKEEDLVLDPFMGSGTTAVVAKKLNRRFIGCDFSKEYCKEAEKRIAHII